MIHYNVIAITHKTSELDEVGRYHLNDAVFESKLNDLKRSLQLDELFYLSTCNRVEFHFVTSYEDENCVTNFFKTFNPEASSKSISQSVKQCLYYKNEDAIRHLFSVASSIDSLVIGEREIITQVRNAYDKCNSLKLTGDYIRILIKKTIETAKEVYTKTEISRKPVSVVSLAYHHLKSLNVPLEARFLIIGSGKTNTSMSHFLKKHGYGNFSIFNRSLENAKILAKEIKGTAYNLSELNTYKGGFDVLVSCTGSDEPIVTESLYKSLLAEETDRKTIIDLAIPNDVDLTISKTYKISLITVDNLKLIAEKNLKEREKELEKCHAIIEKNCLNFKRILKERAIELAMREIPKKVQEIKNIALNEVFVREVNNMDSNSKESLNKILLYIEKKYISMPMKMAKSIMLEDVE